MNREDRHRLDDAVQIALDKVTGAINGTGNRLFTGDGLGGEDADLPGVPSAPFDFDVSAGPRTYHVHAWGDDFTAMSWHASVTVEDGQGGEHRFGKFRFRGFSRDRREAQERASAQFAEDADALAQGAPAAMIAALRAGEMKRAQAVKERRQLATAAAHNVLAG